MPTAAKLVAALCLAAVGFFAAGAVTEHLPVNSRSGSLWAIAACVGLLSGWRVLGPEAPGRLVTALSAGLRATAVMVLVVLFIGSFAEMIQRSLQRQYDGPVHALQAVFALMLENGALILHSDVAGMLLIGGMLAGGLAHRAARIWR